MSRPTGSVPSTKTWPPTGESDGARNAASRNCSLGSYGEIKSAKTAQKTSRPRTTSPITAPRLRRKSRQSSRAGDGGASASGVATVVVGVLTRAGSSD